MKNIFFILGLCSLIPVAEAGTVRIYAAASLTNAVTDIVQLFVKQNPQVKVVTVFGASSALARQIETGAPADLFFSADQDWANYLVTKHKVAKGHIWPLLKNQLVLISIKNRQQAFQPHSKFKFAQSFQGYLCTGEMDSVPVGKYAKQSLSRLHWLDSLQGRIVGTDDARSALAFVERGECQVGIVYRTDALQSKKVQISGIFPEQSHQPIHYPLALTVRGSAKPEAKALLQYMSIHPQAHQVYHHYGFRYGR